MVKSIGCCCALIIVAFLLAGCGGAPEEAVSEAASTSTEPAAPEPDRITVQHILIAFEGSVEGKGVTRSKEEAGQLAQELFERAKGGEDFNALVEEYTDDASPGIYGIVNFGLEGDEIRQVFPREKMMACFGDVGFALEVDEVGLAVYDKSSCKFGWHVIKRLR
ncbi:MAG: peptidylprolyl isomerase [Candidatus Latescibacterota bacterium]|nr:MAG: peptidylprolyl isomerase [Candidatus Latescibacterota bacterium]